MTTTTWRRALAAALLAATTSAQQGVPGYELDIPSPAQTGELYEFCLQTPGAATAFLMVSTELVDPPMQTGAGPFHLALPVLSTGVVPIPESGKQTITCTIPCDDLLEGLSVHFQFGAVLADGERGLSNAATVTVEEGACDIDAGDLVTFTQGGWGAPCAGENPGCLRDASFDDAFPQGLVLGDQDGADGDGLHALVLSGAAAVEAFVPEGGPAGPLLQDDVDPVTSPAGILAGQATATRMNVGFDDAGLLDDLKAKDELLLGDLFVVAGVDEDLLGMTVRELLELADGVLSGEIGPLVDLDGDLAADVGPSEIADALGAVNENFVDGLVDEGVLAVAVE